MITTNRRPLLEVDDIRKSFAGIPILKGVSLTVEEGEFVALLGPSGCGKTTLLRIIAGLEVQDSGHVRVADKVMDELTPAERNIALVFQSYALYPHLTIRQNIALPLAVRRLRGRDRIPGARLISSELRDRLRIIQDDVDRIATAMEIQHLLDRKPGKLSGGQKQRAAVARALVRKPSLLLMDEPLSNLDAKLRFQLRREIVSLHKAHRTTTIYVTHDQSEAMSMADRIAVFLNGELQQVGTPKEIYERPATIAVAGFVGSPQINRIPCALDGGSVMVGTSRIDAHDLGDAGKIVNLAVRPEHIKLGGRGHGGIPVRIVSQEYLGSELLVVAALQHDGTEITIRTDPRQLFAMDGSDQGEIHIDASSMMLFDDAGRRIVGREHQLACRSAPMTAGNAGMF